MIGNDAGISPHAGKVWAVGDVTHVISNSVQLGAGEVKNITETGHPKS